MSGGYAPDVDAIVTIHANTIREAVASCGMSASIRNPSCIRFSPPDRSRRQGRADDGRPHRDDGVGAAAVFARGAGRAAGAHRSFRSTDDAFFGTMPAFVRGGARAANSGAASPASAPRSARSSSPSSAATPRAACRRTSRPSCCSIRRPARCRRCSTAATSPKRAPPRCRRCRRGCSRARRRRRWRSSDRASRRAATSRRCRASTSCVRSRSGVRSKLHRDAVRRAGKNACQTGSDRVRHRADRSQRRGRRPRRRGGGRRRHHRARHLVADAGASRAAGSSRARTSSRSAPAGPTSARWIRRSSRAARLFVDSRAAALVESGDVVMGIQEGRFGADHIVAELGELVAGARRAAQATPRSRSSRAWVWRSRT